jgi:hypothetical protein
MKHILKIIIPALMLGLMSQLGWAEIPNMINYQGYLTDSDGSPIDGTVNLTFSLYDTDSGGSPLWSDSYLVLVVNGLVNKDLGPINLDLIHPVYLGIQIESDPEMSPRQALTSVPFAYVAEKAADTDKLGGIDSSNFLTSETDPTVPANLKDGVNWSEVSNRPTGLDDGDDVGITLETDPEVGSNTTDYVPKWNGSALVTSTIYDNGNVGIGTATPNSKLEVAGTIHSTSGGVKFPDGTTQTTAASGGGSGDGHSLDAADGDPTDAVYVDNSGNVGIGTTTPARKLHISDVMQLEPRTNAPANPSNGDFYFDSTGAFCGYSNGEWFKLGGNGDCTFEIPEFAGGSGTSEDPYQIAFCQQLQNMRDHLSSHFVLNNDIDCSDTVNWNSGAGFEPVGGNGASDFRGNFDGQNHTISNLYINRSTTGQDYVGLFGEIGYGHVLNVTLANVNINGTSDNGSSTSSVGALVGYMIYGTITNVSVSSGQISSTNIAGGLVGSLLIDEGEFVENSYSAASVTVNFSGGDSYTRVYAGGLVGRINANCGGVGQGGDIIKSYSTGAVNVNISNSVDVKPQIGGLVGTLIDGTCGGDIFDSYSLSPVTVTLNNVTTYYTGLFIGGLAGRAHKGIIENSYAAGAVNYTITGTAPTTHIGGLVGDHHNSVANDSYWDTQTTNLSSSALGIGKTTSELQTPTSNTGIYSNWDASKWNFGTSSQYPVLY